jgi:hypothetical protein
MANWSHADGEIGAIHNPDMSADSHTTFTTVSVDVSCLTDDHPNATRKRRINDGQAESKDASSPRRS